MSDCLFCNIAAGDMDADVVHQGDLVMAFRDINPQAPTHILVIPREHIESVRDVTKDHAEMLAEAFDVIVDLAEQEGLDGGYRVVTNIGGDAGQSVDHLHFHLLGGRSMSWPPG